MERQQAIRDCIKLIEELRDDICLHYRIDCEPHSLYKSWEKIDWLQHLNCDPIKDITSALNNLLNEKK